MAICIQIYTHSLANMNICKYNVHLHMIIIHWLGAVVMVCMCIYRFLYIYVSISKGGCVVLMKKSHYKKMIFQHLNDANTYQKTDQKCDNHVMKKIGKLAKKYEWLLTKAEKLYLTNISFSASNFYGLPQRFIYLNK